MNRWTVLATVALLAVACSNPVDNVTQAVVGEAQTETADASATNPTASVAETAGEPMSRQFVLAPESAITFVGSSVARSHDGGFNNIIGTINLVDGRPEASQVNLQIDISTVWTDTDRLTTHLKTPDFFEAETYPTATFVSTSITPADTGYTVTGNLKLHGITKSISFPATIEVADDAIHATSEFSLMRFDWGVAYTGPTNNLVRDEVVVRFDVTAHPADA